MTSDRDLAASAKAGDARAAGELVRRYEARCAGIARCYFLPGADPDDLVQEALCGLLRAIRYFDPGRNDDFAGFAMFAVRRQVITAVKAATRAKHRPLSTSVRHVHDGHGDLVAVTDLLEAKGGDPHVALAAKEERANIVAAIAGLTELERRSVVGVLNGLSYAEIELGEHRINHRSKQVDNALTRARRKLAEAA